MVQRKTKSLSLGGWLLVIFWIIYSVRINYDIHVRGLIFGSATLFKFYTLFYGSGVLAATATLLTTKYINLKKLEQYIYATLIAANTSIILIVLYLYKTFNPIAIAARVQFSVQLSDGSTQSGVLNPIILGFFGEMLALVSLYYLLFSEKIGLYRVKHYLLFLLGLYILIIGASRGPIVFFTAITLYLIALKLFRAKKTRIFYLKITTLPIISLLLFWQFIGSKIPWEKLTIFIRMKSWITNDYSNSLDNRDDKFNFAWEEFLENPIIGSQYLDQFNSYPHNILLEVLMALGLIGGSLLFSIIFIVLFRIIKDSIGEGRFIFFTILVLAHILFCITSGSLFRTFQLWILLALYVTLYKPKISQARTVY